MAYSLMSAGRGTGCAASLATSSGPMGSGSGPGAVVKDHTTRPTHTAPAAAFARLIGSCSGASAFMTR